VKRKWKISIGIIALLVIAAGVAASLRWSRRDLVTVQTGLVARTDLVSLVTASGEIKPRTYINLGANAQGRIVDLLVREGDRVRRGQIVARIENIQATADVNAQRANVASAEADSAASEAGLKVQDDAITTQMATLDRAKAELERARINLDRTTQLVKQQLSPRQDLDKAQIDFASAEASVREADARLSQLRAQRAQTAAQLASAQKRVAQAQAGLTRFSDILAKHDVVAPIDGLVTYLPVRIGETVVPGIQNSAASTVMTIADMSLITAEVKVDETDIVNVELGQPADITVDAMPNQTFHGKVVEIGNTALSRSSGLAVSQSTTSNQEAKDFKVVIALNDPSEEMRPGLSATAKITTATRHDVVTIPLQALTVRQKGDLEEVSKQDKARAQKGPIDLAAEKTRREEVQGVFVINGDKAEFRKVDTGITGVTDIEVTNGLQPGEQIVVGGYRVIRTMRNGSRVKIDNSGGLSDSKS
jgi:HlyD family secretion protein